MSEALQSAKELLAKIEDKLPFKVNEATNPDMNPIIATIRGVDGYPVLAPHPESFSMLTGQREVFEFFVFGPRVIRDLIEEIESSGGENTDDKPETRRKVT